MALPDKNGKEGSGRVFSIPPGTSFLEELAVALVEGRLVKGFRPADDPLALPGATVYLPTRRAARVFSGEIVRALGGRAALLPQIRTLGDSDEDELALAFSAAEDAELQPTATPLERQLQLGVLVRGWTTALSRATRELFGDEDIVIPSSAADALKLAGDLARLLDQMETEEVPWQTLDGLAGAEHAQWWDLTLAFLKIVTESWPAHLQETGRLDPAVCRRKLLDLRARQIAAGAAGPVIAAGSTGSIPATARLLGTIARLEQGAVVLPGVDLELPEPVWRQLSRPAGAEEAPGLSTHPQFGLARLLAEIGVAREAVEMIGTAAAPIRSRMAVLNLAMLPAAETGRWPQAADSIADAALHEGISVIEAPGEREEALAIAIAMREALATPGRTAALTTPDRSLARRVAAELGRFGVQVDDSAGTPLHQTVAGKFVQLLLSATTQPADPVRLTAFVKETARHRNCGDEQARLARLFELTVLRDALTVPSPGDLEAAVDDAKHAVEKAHFVPDIIRQMQDGDWEGLAELARHIDRACRPIAELAESEGGVALAAAMAATRLALALLLDDPQGERLIALAGGREVVRLFDEFDALATGGAGEGAAGGAMLVPYGELGDVFLALSRNIVVHEIRHPHPRLHIWGPLEARLQSVDLMILGGLNEGKWPAAARNDPFLNRPMKGEIGLSFPERRIGQSAHDFQQLSGSPEIIFTRALKADNAPTVASRWLQRLMTVAGQDNRKRMLEKGARYLRLAEAVDAGGQPPRRAVRPCPRPPLELRPNSLSITEIETWIRDPYAVHARHVLGLKPLPPLERVADPALRGTVYHDVFARFVQGRPAGEDAAQATARFEAIARDAFDRHQVPAQTAHAWLPRLIEAGGLFLDWEAGRHEAVKQSLCEVSGRIEVNDTGFVLRGRADRIDLLADGTAAIFDYKTGLLPSAKQARIFSPQLSLEAKMAELGAFGAEATRPTSDMAYIRLRSGEELQVDHIATDKPGETAAELVSRAWAELAALISAYRNPEQGYLSRYAVMQEGEVGGDYDHLARVREWSIGEASGEDGDD